MDGVCYELVFPIWSTTLAFSWLYFLEQTPLSLLFSFSPLRWEEDTFRQDLSNFSLEKIMQTKQYLMIQQLLWLLNKALATPPTTSMVGRAAWLALIGRATLPLTTQAALWGEAWWRVQEFRPSELPGDSHRKPMESGGGHPLAHRDRFLPLSPALSHRISLPSRRQWWGISCRSCGGSSEIGVKWL